MKITVIILKYRKSKSEILEQIKQIVDMSIEEYLVIDNSVNNRGTAAGFTEGMKQVKDGFIWLLDEDNIPEPNALEKLKKAWITYGSHNRSLASYRKTYDKTSDIESVIGGRNSCYGLNIFKKHKPLHSYADCYDRQIPYSMFGGMFFHSDLLKIIGYPDEKYFIYCDDYDWSYRITKSGGKILLVKDSIINEPPHRTDNEYYRVRNAIWFSKQFVTNRLHFYINCLIYKTYLKLTGKKERLRAVRDGFKNLG